MALEWRPHHSPRPHPPETGEIPCFDEEPNPGNLPFGLISGQSVRRTLFSGGPPPRGFAASFPLRARIPVNARAPPEETPFFGGGEKKHPLAPVPPPPVAFATPGATKLGEGFCLGEINPTLEAFAPPPPRGEGSIVGPPRPPPPPPPPESAPPPASS